MKSQQNDLTRKMTLIGLAVPAPAPETRQPPWALQAARARNAALAADNKVLRGRVQQLETLLALLKRT